MATKKEMFAAIKKHCFGCRRDPCNVVLCPLHPIVHEPVQQNAFNGDGYKSAWIKKAVGIANDLIGPFWFSYLRMIVETVEKPTHPSWWGAVGSALRRAGYTQVARRKSPESSRNGAAEWCWAKNN
jgi:hypothetical protein